MNPNMNEETTKAVAVYLPLTEAQAKAIYKDTETVVKWLVRFPDRTDWCVSGSLPFDAQPA